MGSPSPEGVQDAYDLAVRESLDIPLIAHVRVTGLKRIHPKVLEKDLEAIKRCQTLRDVTLSVEQITEKWKSTGLFKETRYYFQPTEDGTSEDICVHMEVDEQPATKSIGIMTTDNVYPEINLSFDNVLGGRYSLKGSFISPASRVHAISASLLSNVPFLGTRAEYVLGHRTEKKYYQLGSSERVFEMKAVAHNHKRGMNSECTLGMEQRRLTPIQKLDIPGEDLVDFLHQTYKGYVRHDLSLFRLRYHHHQQLFDMYPLPIGGHVFHAANELAGGIFGGDFSFLKSELQFSKFWSLGPFFSLHWGTRVAGIVTDKGSRIPYNDRLFLANSHIRGFKSVGPSTLDGTRVPAASRFAATGGNALWASSLSVSFPFLGFPSNGFAAMHVFANAGNLRMVHSMSQLTDYWRWIRESACSIGAGIVVTRVPLVGVLPSGRFELNCSLPLGVTRNGSLTTSNGPKELFERVKFGLVWSSQTSL